MEIKGEFQKLSTDIRSNVTLLTTKVIKERDEKNHTQ